MSRSLGQLLRRFRLPQQATEAELKNAYLKEAKRLHPDVAGKSSEEAFQKLQQEYEEAMKLMKGGSPPQDYAQPHPHPRRPHYANWTPPRQPPRPPPPPPPRPWTPAERLRNMLCAAGGVFVGVLFFVVPSLSHRDERALPDQTPAPAGPRTTPPEKKVVPGYQPIPEYYKRRTSKGSVRVRDSDTYVSTTEAAKSRSTDEGLGSGFTAVGSLWAGSSPSEAKVAARAPVAPEGGSGGITVAIELPPRSTPAASSVPPPSSTDWDSCRWDAPPPQPAPAASSGPPPSRESGSWPAPPRPGEG